MAGVRLAITLQGPSGQLVTFTVGSFDLHAPEAVAVEALEGARVVRIEREGWDTLWQDPNYKEKT